VGELENARYGQDIVIHVTVYGPGSTAKATINVKIVDLDRNPPPNPVADDRNDSFTAAAVPSRPVQASASWTVWRPWWHANWVWYSTGETAAIGSTRAGGNSISTVQCQPDRRHEHHL
jgi:hypothetical protein